VERREGQQSIKGAAARPDHLSCLEALRKYECESGGGGLLHLSLSLSGCVHTYKARRRRVCVENSDTWSAAAAAA
jgi:hypothetical protein